MRGVKVSIDRFVVDFTDVYWSFFNPFRQLLCERHNARFVKSIEQPTYSIYRKDPSDFLINGLMELLEAYQRLEIAMKLSRGRNKKAQQGGYAGGRAAFGYKAKKGQKAIEVHVKEAAAVQRLFESRNCSRTGLYLNWRIR